MTIRNIAATAVTRSRSLQAVVGGALFVGVLGLPARHPEQHATLSDVPSTMRFVTARGDSVRFTETLRIGPASGFDFGLVALVVPTGDGGVIVEDPRSLRSGEIFFRFDSLGRFVHAIGHIGAGPGEYTPRAIPIRLSDGSILVADPGNARFTKLSTDDKVLGSWPVPTNLGGTSTTAALDGGWFAEVDNYGARPGHPAQRLFIHFSSVGRVVDTIPPSQDYLDGPFGGDFSPDARIAILPNGDLVTAQTDQFDVAVHHRNATTRIRRRPDIVRYTEDEANARSATMPPGTPGLPVAGHPKPTFHRMRSDDEGRIIMSMDGPGIRQAAGDRVQANGRPRPIPSALWIDLLDPVRGYLGRLIPPPGATYGAVAIYRQAVWSKVDNADGTQSVIRATPSRPVW